MTTPNRIRASFRDPAGFVYRTGDRVIRQVNQIYRSQYRMLMESGLYDVLIATSLMVPHQEIEDIPFPASDGFKLLEPVPIKFISYPYEWCFSQLKDAALLTLKIQKLALEHGMTLKDATAYNIQFIGARPVFIDTLSFEEFNGRPWVAYQQFCQHFLAPLALVSKTDRRLSQLLKVFLDGIPLDLTASLLPGSSRLNLGLLMHIHLHARSQQKYAGAGTDESVSRKVEAIRLTPFKATALVDQLISTVEKLVWPLADTEWGDYYGDTNYQDDALREKANIIDRFCAQLPEHCRTYQDLGANDGKFGRAVASHADLVVCHDIDESAVEKNYLAARKAGDDKILPLVQNLVNPSPAIGWANRERDSLAQRGPLDVSMALALIHHLAISNNVPLAEIAEYFSTLSTYLIIEFVPKQDSQVRRLLATREDIFPLYSREGFEQAFQHRYKIIDRMPIAGSERTLYLMKILD